MRVRYAVQPGDAGRRWHLLTDVMNICFIGKNVLRPELADNQLDAPIFIEFGKRFEEVFLVYETDGPRATESHAGNVHIYLVPRSRRGLRWPGFVRRSYATARRIHREHGFAVVSASDPFGGGVVGLLLKFRLRTRLVMQIQGQVLRLPKESYSWLRRRTSRTVTLLACRYADAVRCVSQEIADEALRAGVAARKLSIIPGRCDTNLFDPARYRDAREGVRARHGIDAEAPVVVFLGRVEAHKGAGELLAALPGVDRLHALMVGDVAEPEAITETVRDLGLSDRVTLAGRVPHDEVPAYLRAGDIFVLPSRHEGTPRAVLEAMSMELAVVASAVGGIPEVINDGVTGVLLKENTQDEIAVVFRHLLSGEVDRHEMGRAARRYVVQHHEFKPLAERVIDLHEQVGLATAAGGVR